MKAFVDKDACISCGLCTSLCPEVFIMSEDGKAVAINEEFSQFDLENVKKVTENCPVYAITIE